MRDEDRREYINVSATEASFVPKFDLPEDVMGYYLSVDIFLLLI